MGALRRDPTLLAALFFFIAAPVLMLARPRGEPRASAQREYGLLSFFDVTVQDEAARQVRFEWSFRPDLEDTEMTCTLDVDDDGIFEESIEDCDGETSLDHSYDEPGTYRAVLIARDRSGNADRAVTTVVLP